MSASRIPEDYDGIIAGSLYANMAEVAFQGAGLLAGPDGGTGMLKLGEGGIQARLRSLIFAWWQGLWKNLEEQR